MQPLERLLNLVVLLLETRRPLTFEEIRDGLAAYDQEDVASAKRQFERDKDQLRDIGIPLEVAPVDVWESAEGYRIPKERYYLPQIELSPEEAAALFVAARGSRRGDDAGQALVKLLVGSGSGLLGAAEAPGTAGPDASAPHLPAAAEAASRRRRVAFTYRSARGEERERSVDAWGLVFRRGSWYLVGRDVAQDEPRAFRLSRIRSSLRDTGAGEAPPEGFRAAEHIVAGPWGVGEPEGTARVAFSPKVAWWAVPAIPGAQVASTRPDGWTEADVPAAPGEEFVSWVLSFGPDAVVVAPAELRRAVVERLEAFGAAG
ncbi:MAG TPA: WYL domain-containing protein [Actinomycetota bacterium]|nr:WYL domain-containing protein [Actinomycetota bacterium]